MRLRMLVWTVTGFLTTDETEVSVDALVSMKQGIGELG
jgi:hypothetical protein